MKTILNVKVDKKNINTHLHRFINDREIYIGVPLKPTKKFVARLKKIDADIKTGRNLSPEFSSMDEAITYLNK